jgi:transposase, IS5 family
VTYLQQFTVETFFQHALPQERTDLSHWRKLLGSKARSVARRELASGAWAGAAAAEEGDRAVIGHFEQAGRL